jgi:hypothetical protein
MDIEDRNSKIGKAAKVLYHKLEEGERALNSIISEKFSEGQSTDTENLNLKIGEAAGVLYHRLEEGECTLNQIKNHLAEKGFDSSIAIMAIGWLAREDKIRAYKTSNKWSLKLN